MILWLGAKVWQCRTQKVQAALKQFVTVICKGWLTPSMACNGSLETGLQIVQAMPVVLCCRRTNRSTPACQAGMIYQDCLEHVLVLF
jgi:hypothetical protein